MKVSQAIRYALQAARNGETNRSLARKFNLDPRTVARWRGRSHVLDLERTPLRQGRRKMDPLRVALLCSARLATGWPLDRLWALFGAGPGRPVSRQQVAAVLASRQLLRPASPRRIPRPAAYLAYFLIADSSEALLLVESWFSPKSGNFSLHARRVAAQEAIIPVLSNASRNRTIRMRPGERIHCSHISVSAAVPRAVHRPPWWWKSLRRRGGEHQELPLIDLAIPGAVLGPIGLSRHHLVSNESD